MSETNPSRVALGAAYVAAALFVVAFDPTHFVGLLPSFVLLPVWLVLVGRLLHRGDERRHVSIKGGEPTPLTSS